MFSDLEECRVNPTLASRRELSPVFGAKLSKIAESQERALGAPLLSEQSLTSARSRRSIAATGSLLPRSSQAPQFGFPKGGSR
jgi:hypothetical protein